MSQNWVTNLDLCAMNGIIDYDAGAYLRGLPPRYIGNPTNPVPPMCPPPYGKQPGLAPQAVPVDKLDLSQKNPCQKQNRPQVDKTPVTPEIFEPTMKKSTPVWKSLLFTAVAVGSAIFIGCKLKNTKIMKSLGKFFKHPFQNTKAGLSKFWNWVKKPFTKKP